MKKIYSFIKKQFLILSSFILIKTMLRRKLGLDTSGLQQLLLKEYRKTTTF